jgi:hypothetical protein
MRAADGRIIIETRRALFIFHVLHWVREPLLPGARMQALGCVTGTTLHFPKETERVPPDETIKIGDRMDAMVLDGDSPLLNTMWKAIREHGIGWVVVEQQRGKSKRERATGKDNTNYEMLALSNVVRFRTRQQFPEQVTWQSVSPEAKKTYKDIVSTWAARGWVPIPKLPSDKKKVAVKIVDAALQEPSTAHDQYHALLKRDDPADTVIQVVAALTTHCVVKWSKALGVSNIKQLCAAGKATVPVTEAEQDTHEKE